MKNNHSKWLAFLLLVFLVPLVHAADPVTLQVNNALVYANPGQSFTLTFTINNPNPSTNAPAFDQFDLYLRDLKKAHVSITGYQPQDWDHGRIERYDDDHFSKTAFSDGTIAVTFTVDSDAPVGKYPLYGYFSYYGDSVGFSPTDLGETIGPVNDDQNYQYATLVVTQEIVNPITVSPLTDSSNFMLYAIILLVIMMIAAFFWQKNQSKAAPNKAVPNKRRY